MLRAQLYHYSKINGFALVNKTYLPDFKVDLVEYQHTASKARLVHLECDDENKAFASAFRSQVENSRGTPHILEHIICCGSEKYPVRDPFMAMAKRSLNTYMNAWTGPDFIAFPFASANEKDFHNLLDVYLDLMFRPQLKLQDFRQEGWRLDVEGEGEIKGVVYNEMKGVSQSAENMFHQYILDHVMAGTEYAYNYGGDPRHIPQLQHQELIDFYKKTFDPSASIFYLYGRVDCAAVAAKLNNYLGEHVQPTQIRAQTLHSLKPQDVLPLPPSVDESGGKQAQVSFTYVLGCSLMQDPVKNLAFGVLQSVLFEPFAGLLYKEIIDAGLAESFGKMVGSEMYGPHTIFNFAFQGVDRDRTSVDKIGQVIEKVLTKLANEGCPEDMVEGALHQTEIQTKMPNSEQGLRLLDYVLPALLHNHDLISPFSVSETIQQLREKIKQGYLQEIIREEFLNNAANQTIVFAQPQPDYLKALQQQELDLVGGLYNSLSTQEKAATQQLNDALEEDQDTQQDLSVLPTLSLKDISVTQPTTTYTKTHHGEVPIYYVQESTNGMTFVKLKFDLGTVTNALRQYLSMFCTFITKVGTQELKNEDLTKILNLNATGFDASFDSYCDPLDDSRVKTHITISIACLDSKVPTMMALLLEILTEALFMDRDNVSSVLRSQSISYQSDLLENSLHYAMNLTNKHLRENALITDLNLSTKFFINYATQFNKIDNSGKTYYLDDFNFQMTSIMNYLMKQHRISVLVHTQAQDHVHPQIEMLLDGLKSKYEGFTLPTHDNFVDAQHAYRPTYVKQATILPSQVNFVVQGHKIPGFGHPDTAALYVLGTLLSNTFLHKEIREKGGAYGSGCSVSPMKGVMNMWSYRDPNILETLDTYARIHLDDVQDADLQEAKFSIFQKLDRPKDPQSKGIEEIFYGITPLMQEQIRTSIINTNLSEVKRVFDEHWISSLKNDQCAYGIFSNQEHNDIDKLKNRGFKVEQFL